MTDDEKLEIRTADALLSDWYRWTKAWRPALGTPRVSAASRSAVSSRQYDLDANAEKIYLHEMETVDWCVDALELRLQVAIGTEMRNRESGVKVWRDPYGATYADVLEAIIPLMKTRELL